MNKLDKHLIRWDMNSSKEPIYPYLPDTIMYLENSGEGSNLEISPVTNKCFSLPLDNCTIENYDITLDITEVYDDVLDYIFINNNDYMQISIVFILKNDLTFNESWGNTFGMSLYNYNDAEENGLYYSESSDGGYGISFDNEKYFYKSLSIVFETVNEETVIKLYLPSLYRTSISDFEEIRIYQCRDKATYLEQK